METIGIKDYPILDDYLKQSKDPLAKKIFDTIFQCGQEKNLFQHLDTIPDPYEKLDRLIELLKPVEQFYDVLGGIKAYHKTFEWLLNEKKEKREGSNFLLPHSIDITSITAEVNHAVRYAIEHQEMFAEFYPIGGAGDRLNLIDEATNEPLPVAMLPFRSHTLLEGLLRDLQAKEYLCYKLRGIQVITPVAMMTSSEKRNNELIIETLEKNHWFHRGESSFRLFIQPLVPVISEDAVWAQSSPLTLCMKPGGHGVIWKMAHDSGVFKWLAEQNISKGLVRQINNPISGIDYGLLAFMGWGMEHDKLFGFASCERVVNAAEGMNILIEKFWKSVNNYEYSLSNIEYTNFSQEGIQDIPCEPGSPYSAYPCNTNILFIDLPTIDKLCMEYPLPGILINLKSTFPILEDDGTISMKKGGRIESTMQNIADYLTITKTAPLEDPGELPVFITYNKRVKTISVTKHQYFVEKKGVIIDTPEGALRDFLTNCRELLTQHCKFELPPQESIEEYLKTGPAFYFDHHPCLGPLYTVIGHKLRGGVLQDDAELILELAEVDIENLNVDGSLIIKAIHPCGHTSDDDVFQYSNLSGKCSLKNVSIRNKGIDRGLTVDYWKGDPVHHERCLIEIEGDGEFHAENVVLEGSKTYFVPEGHRLVVTQESTKIYVIKEPTWYWDYRFGENDKIELRVL